LVRDENIICHYYSEKKSKSKIGILLDNLYWLFRFQEHNDCYYTYGFDTKPLKEQRRYIGHIECRDVRDRANRRWARGKDTTSYCGLVADKFVFGMYLSSLGFPTPRVLGLCQRGFIYWNERRKKLPISSLLTSADMDVFCKEVLEGMGVGIFTVRVVSGSLYIDGKESVLEEFEKRMQGSYILQERVEQHSRMNSLCPSCVNTIRLVTVFRNGQPEPLAGVVRVGVKGSRVDNWSAGGLVGPIDLHTGRLGKYFFFRPGIGGRAEYHPDTGVAFDGFEVPFIEEAVRMSCDVHSFYYGIHSIGWDIAITPEGPTFLEANDEWGIKTLQVVHGGLMAEFLGSLKKGGCTDAPKKAG
jgi:hypothetical protein